MTFGLAANGALSKQDGQEFSFHDIFKEIVEHEMVSNTFEFEPKPDMFWSKL